MIGQTISHYEIVDKIGEGEMGVVYLAQDTRLKRKVALKVLPEDLASDPDRLERFRREATSVAQLNHPNVVTIHSVEEADGLHFLTMELVEGERLGELIPTDGLPLARLFDLAIPLADAVGSAHQKGITHRDLKPDNVMVTEQGHLKVLDFGLAKKTDLPLGEAGATQLATATITQEGKILGTVPYMSPEQLRGEEVDHRSDIFSLGILVHELATGRRPFGGATRSDVTSSILRDTPPLVTQLKPDLPRHLGRIVARCLEKAPADRYQTARDVFNELRALRRETASQPRSEPRSALDSDDGSAIGPEVPWIAVRTLECHADDPDLEALADGLAEDITSGLSRFSHLLVVSHSSARALDGKPVDLREVGRELGARYVMEGSLRRDGPRLRITVNLIDAQTGTHLWTETYDRDLDQIGVFELQDELTDRIVATVADPHGALTRSLALATASKPSESLTSHEAVLRSFFFRQRVSAEDHLQARIALEHAAEREPNNAEVLAALAYIYVQEFNQDFNPLPDSLSRALAAARRAVEADPASQFAHYALAKVYFHDQNITAFRASAERALQLNRRSSDTMALLGIVFGLSGDWQRGNELTTRAMELNPHHPGWYRLSIFYDAYRQERYDEALEIAQQMNMPEYWLDPLARTLANAQLGDEAAARSAARDLLRVWPDFETRFQQVGIEAWFHFVPELAERILDGLAKAGLQVVTGGA